MSESSRPSKSETATPGDSAPRLETPLPPSAEPSAPSRESRLSNGIPYPHRKVLEPRKVDCDPRRFGEGRHAPYGVRWYGATSLYGHFRSFISRAVAAEQVDSRDWMRPASPQEMLRNCLAILGGDVDAASLTEGLDRTVVIDFAADTGDDRDTSFAVGKMLAQAYVVNEGGEARLLPRGDLLLFGGDVAYPVATADEIHRRLTAPWNEAFRSVRGRGPTEPRILLGVPGNHDWYDGLDGFGRLFRRSVDVPTRRDGAAQPRLVRKMTRLRTRPRASGAVGLVARKLHLDELSGTLRMVGSVSRSIRAFFTGIGKKRRRRLTFHGYEATQEASYFALPVAPGLDLWGCDRQLGRMDFRQRQYFLDLRAAAPERGLLFLAADPALAYGEINAPGAALLKATGLNLDDDPLLYLSGDFHHYERSTVGPSTHVVAGGGGAFLHGTRITPLRRAVTLPPYGTQAQTECSYPSAAASRRLVLGVPWKLMLGRSGYLVHLGGALLGSTASELRELGTAWLVAGTLGMATAVTALFFLIAGFERAHPRSVAAVAVPFGVAIGILPTVIAELIPAVLPKVAGITIASASLSMLCCAFLSALLFGFFLQVVAILGFEHQQAFTVLGHQGYKHFVRLFVHPTGLVEGFTIGMDDPHSGADPVLVDRFSWSMPTRSSRTSRGPSAP